MAATTFRGLHICNDADYESHERAITRTSSGKTDMARAVPGPYKQVEIARYTFSSAPLQRGI